MQRGMVLLLQRLPTMKKGINLQNEPLEKK